MLRLLPAVAGLGFAAVASASAVSPRDALDGTVWKYQGCWTDPDPKARVLAGKSKIDDEVMTQGLCLDYCDKLGFHWAGLENGSECYCDYGVGKKSIKKPDSYCNSTCSGDGAQLCGGPSLISLFWNGEKAPATHPGAGNWESMGCFDSEPGRALRVGIPFEDPENLLTVDKCLNACEEKGYHYAGLEYGSECYCDK
jgi:hypothetical protein